MSYLTRDQMLQYVEDIVEGEEVPIPSLLKWVCCAHGKQDKFVEASILASEAHRPIGHNGDGTDDL